MKKPIFFLLIVLAIATAGFFIFSMHVRAPLEKDTVSSKISPKPVSLEQKSLSFGDVFWARYLDDAAQKSTSRFAFPFQGLQTFEREKYDFWAANMECPVLDLYLTSAQQNSNLQFACLKDYLTEAARWFSVFSLANNHTGNQGSDGFELTKQNMVNNDIQFFGHYLLSKKEDLCEIVGLPARLKSDDSSEQKVVMPIALCGFHVVSGTPNEEQIAEIAKVSQYFPTWVWPHGGTEYKTEPNPSIESLYRKFIDAGADIVLGGHPHRVQTAEAYKGKLIVYSLGNFIFDQKGGAFQGYWEVWRGMGLDVTMDANYDANLQKYLDLGKKCQEFKDTCLADAESGNLTKPAVSYKYNFVATDNSDLIVKKASEEWQNLTRERLNWDAVMAQLGQ